MRAYVTQAGYTIDHIACKMKTVEVIEHGHVEGRGGGTLLFVTADMQIVMVRAPVREPVNQPRVAVECKNDRFVGRENRVELMVGEAVRMFGCGLDCHQIDYVHEADF